MFQRVSKHLTPSTAIAFLALIFALTGGAFAATGGGSGGPSHATALASAAKSKAKAKTGPRGPAGPKGPTGATGATGATGSAGATGPAGAKGENGAPGASGALGDPGAPGKNGGNGTSVTAGEFAGEKVGEKVTCKEGGNELKSGANVTYLCNGKEGSPWTAGGTLPPGKSEIGSWSTVGLKEIEHYVFAPIFFPLPLSGGVAGAREISDHLIIRGETAPAGCTGGTAEAPTAEPGNLCIYVTNEEQASVTQPNPGVPGTVRTENAAFALAADKTTHVGATGGLLEVEVTGAEGYAYGTWAVTAKEA